MEGKVSTDVMVRKECIPNLTIQPTVTEKKSGHTEYATKLLTKLHTLFITPELTDVPEVTRMTSQKFTLEQVKEHSDCNSCWIVLHDKVYDVTEFLFTHPGGCEIILENAGIDATVPFESKGHSKDAYSMLHQYCIGELTKNDHRIKTMKTS